MNILKHRWASAARVLTAALLAGGLGLAALSAHAADDPPGRVGRLAEMRGQVWFLEEGQGEWQAATINRPVTTADRVATDRDGRLEMQIGSTTVRLDEASDLEINRLDDDRIELTLHSGTASLRVREPEVAREIQLTTQEGRFQPRGPGLFRIDRTDRGSFGAANQGELDFESSDSQLTLRPGQRAELWFENSDGRTHYSWSTPASDDFEQWVRRDDSREQRYAERHPISPEMTGADDLEGNGQWATHPEYGAVWYPTTVVAGWAPYRYGHWAWVRPWGWTWIDDAPWGFAPFHYGRWFYWGSRWCWAPGTYVRRPVYAPAMVAWVGGPHLSVSVSVGQPVGWVPLAPREAYYPTYRVSPVYIKQVNVTHVTVVQPAQPSRPIMYANSRVNGGVTVVSSDVLTRRQAVAAAARPADPEVIRAIGRERGGVVAVAPPTPSNASFAPRRAVPVNPTAQPRIAAPGRGGQVRGDSEEGRAARLQQSSPGDPRGGFGVQARQPDSPAANRPATGPGREGREGRDGPDDRPARAVNPAPVQPAPAPQGEAGRQRLPRPPLSGSPSDEGVRRPGQPAQVVPQPRREADVPGFAPAREREPQPQRDARELQPQRPHQQQPQVQQVMPQPQPQPQPQRAVPRDEPRQERHERQAERQRERDDRQDHRRRDNDNR